MRILPALIASLILLATPLAAQGKIGVSATILPREELTMADAPGVAPGAARARLERTRGGETRVSVPLVLTHRVRPVVTMQQRAGDPACELVADAARTDAGWGTTLRCTGKTAEGGWARVLIVPNT